ADHFSDGEYGALACYNAAVCYEENEDWTAAIGGYVRFLADFPHHENGRGLWPQIASLYHEELGDYEQAIEAYEAAFASAFENAAGQPDAPLAEIRFRQGECHEKLGQLDAALQRYEAAATGPATDPFRIASLAQMGKILEERGDWAGAIAAFERIVAADGKPEWTAMAQGRIEAIRNTTIAGS
ncbi:MAG: tetratricopeptide repeat protein, partial [bacterium]